MANYTWWLRLVLSISAGSRNIYRQLQHKCEQFKIKQKLKKNIFNSIYVEQCISRKHTSSEIQYIAHFASEF